MKIKNKLYLNTISALILQLVTFICGFILPKQMLIYYGSEVNGLVTSISRFLSIISFLEFGVGAVIQSNLYKPLVEKNNEMLSKIIISSERFYKKIAYIFLMYIIILSIVYPKINKEFDYIYTVSLIAIIAFSTFVQYYFGIMYQNFLNADQKIYICSVLQIITIILNTVLCIFLMRLGCSIHFIKLISTFIFIIRPIFQNIYVKNNYNLNLKIKYTEEPIKQKWNGFAQHIAAVITSEMDVILLTFFIGYKSVSIYSVYFLVVNGVTLIIMTAVSGLESYWGNLLAMNKKKDLYKSFKKVEFFIHATVVFLYTSTAVLIAPFISVYILGTSDEELYYLPLFGMVLTFAYAAQCLRIPYFRIIKAAGHYKETQNGAFVSMLLNIIISIFLLKDFGLIGVALGTLVAMIYHTIYFANYLRNNILNNSLKIFLKYIFLDLIVVILVFYFTKNLLMTSKTYLSWIIYAIKVSLVSLSFTSGCFCIFYYFNQRKIFDKL